MSSENTVEGIPLPFGAAGTSTLVAAGTTNTSLPRQLPSNNYTVQVTQASTGTSISAATIIWQASNDNITYFPIGSATTLPSTNASTSTTYQGAGITVVGARYAFGRAVLGSTGTGNASAWLGS